MKDYGSGTTVFDLVYPNLVMGENTVLCPFHPERTPSMQINTMQKIYHCFGCGAKLRGLMSGFNCRISLVVTLKERAIAPIVSPRRTT